MDLLFEVIDSTKTEAFSMFDLEENNFVSHPSTQKGKSINKKVLVAFFCNVRHHSLCETKSNFLLIFHGPMIERNIL